VFVSNEGLCLSGVMIYKLTIPRFLKALENLDACLDKGAHFAEQKKIDPEVLLQSRLAPDQFPLLRQIQISCDTAKLAAARLTGKTAPSHPDTEKTWADCKTRIRDTVEYLRTFSEQDFQGAESREISNKYWDGQQMRGDDYVLHHVLPNLYFHVTTAYAILRHNGVEIGKKDYLGALPFISSKV
jgi:uncharacterized protein